MAESPSHKFGQIIGEILEVALREPLRALAKKHGLYLDYEHPRPSRGGKRSVSWRDRNGNVHDLDYVLEEGGTEEAVGKPKAFIEIAWRRYTKHSRNKAQEIQGAIIPLAETYSEAHPCLGVVLAGVFTEGSLNQLSSLGFHILYYPYELVVEAFAQVGIDAHFDEDTPDSVLQQKVRAYGRLPETEKLKIATTLRALRENDLTTFLNELEVSITRRIATIRILPLHGSPQELQSITDAITFLENFVESRPSNPFVRYEVMARYTNGDEIRGEFQDKSTAIAFLRNLQ